MRRFLLHNPGLPVVSFPGLGAGFHLPTLSIRYLPDSPPPLVLTALINSTKEVEEADMSHLLAILGLELWPLPVKAVAL